jgi:iron transport multicopper oxidase
VFLPVDAEHCSHDHFSMLRALALLATAPLSVLAGVQELWWNITYVENINPDGLFPRRVIGLNGTWP